MTNRFPELQPSDVILTRGTGVVSFGIRVFGTIASGGALVNHSLIYHKHGVSVESVPPRTRFVDLNDVYATTPCIIFRHRHLSDDLRMAIADKAASAAGQAYGATKFPLFILDAITPGYFFTRTFSITHFKVCSQLVAWAYEKKLHGPSFGVSWKSVMPDTQYDWCMRHPENWHIVFNSLPGVVK